MYNTTRGISIQNVTYFSDSDSVAFFSRPIGRKGFHRKSSSPDMMREKVETESKELKSNKSHVEGEATPWVLDGRTGIYYPKGHEKVLESIPDGGGAVVNTQVNWFNDENI